MNTPHTHPWLTPRCERPDLQRLRVDLEPCGQTTLMQVRGDIDAYTLSRWQYLLESALVATADEGGYCLLVDLSHVHFASVRAILAIPGLAELGCRRRVRLGVVDARPHSATARIVAMAGLQGWLPVYADLVDAVTESATDAPGPPPVRGRGDRRPRR